MSWRCIGCGNHIGWDGKGTLCYTCPCESRIFYDDESDKLASPASLLTSGRLALPASLIITMRERRQLPHLDYLIGRSDFTSPLKEKLIEELKSQGAVWMKDCEQCVKDGTYQAVLDRERALAVLEAEAIIRRQNLG